MTALVNEKILKSVCNEAGDNYDLIDFLNSIIDDELSKNEPDCDLIDDCINTINELEGINDKEEISKLSLSPSTIIKIVNSNKFSWKKLNITLRIAIVAAVIATSTISVNAAVKAITSKDLFEQIGIVENVDENISDVTTTTKEVETTVTQELTTIPKKDDSYFVSSEKLNNDLPVIKNIQYCGDYTLGKKINYKKKGDSIKSTLTFIQEDDFDEKNYLIGEYGPVGAFYCETDDGSKIKHEFTDWIETKSSTCKDRGEKVRTCNLCSKVQKCPVEKKSEHICTIDDTMPLTPATDNQQGHYIYKCKTCSALFERNQPKPQKIVLSQDLFFYNGKTQKPTVIAVLDENGEEIAKQYYTISYSYSSSKNVYPEYAVCINFNSPYYSGNIQTVYFIYPPISQIEGITSLDNSINVYWKKNSLINQNNTTGYQIEYSRNSNFSNSKKVNVNGMNINSKQISGLSSNATYYVRMRVYYFDEFQCNNIYSRWSDVRAVVVK